MKMNRRKYRKCQTIFEKQQKIKKRVIDKLVSKGISKKAAISAIELVTHSKAIYFPSYREYKKTHIVHPIKTLRETIKNFIKGE